MNQKPKLLNLVKSLAALVATFAGCTASLFLYFGSVPNLSMPLVEGQDALFFSTYLKIIQLQNWWPGQLPATERLAAPFGLSMGDFPMGNYFECLAVKLFGITSSNPYFVYNLYYFASFYIVALVFFLCVRRLGVSRLLAIPLSIAFSILPMHYARYAHFFSVQYGWIAVLCLITIILAFNRDPFGRGWRRITLLLVALASLGGIYNEFFFCLFVCVTGLMNTRMPNPKLRYKSIALIIGVTVVCGSLSFIPNIIYNRKYGSTGLTNRSIADSEIAGLRLSTFMLPTNDYFFEPVRAKVRTYLDAIPNVEGKDEYGGALAILFLLVSGGAVFASRSRLALRRVGLLNIAGILYGSIGALNIIFGLLVTTSFRSLNRISVFLACFALYAAALVLKRFTRQWPILLQALFALVLTIIVIFDQTPGEARDINPPSVDRFEMENAFFKSIEAKCAAGSAILQLPYTPFPEAPPVGRMLPYEHFKAFIATDTIRWSYGAIQMRQASAMLAQVSQLPLKIEELQKLGFSGVEVDSFGYADQAPQALEQIQKTLGAGVASTFDHRYFFFIVPGGSCSRSKP